MAEWLKAHAWKACLGETLTWVRIPLSPPDSKGLRAAAISLQSLALLSTVCCGSSVRDFSPIQRQRDHFRVRALHFIGYDITVNVHRSADVRVPHQLLLNCDSGSNRVQP